MRLLLDEHISAVVAEQLRRRGHDVVALTEVELQGSGDEAILVHAIENGRTLVTNNIRDFRPLHARYLTTGVMHYGIVLVPTSAYSLKRAGFGALIHALDELLAVFPTDDALRDTEYFL